MEEQLTTAMCPLHPELVQLPAVWTAAGLEHTRSHRRLIAGGLGGFGVELAAMRGLRVIGTAGPADEEALAALSSLASAGRLTLRSPGHTRCRRPRRHSSGSARAASAGAWYLSRELPPPRNAGLATSARVRG